MVIPACSDAVSKVVDSSSLEVFANPVHVAFGDSGLVVGLAVLNLGLVGLRGFFQPV